LLISLIVPNPPGGVVDTSARLLAEPLSKLIGQPVVVENKGGASGNIAYQQVAQAPKDGYTLLISYSAYHVGNPSMFAKLPWAQKDFVPVALLTAATNVITAHAVGAGQHAEGIHRVRQGQPGQAQFRIAGQRLAVPRRGRRCSSRPPRRHDPRALQGLGRSDPGCARRTGSACS
jgi:tripartite-type tricarboxylate transporter receptor subunit TctC